MTTFETAEVGDNVYDIRYGWDTITGLYDKVVNSEYTIITESGRIYTNEGLHYTSHKNRTLFWDEVIITAPCKPVPPLEVDAKVLVWDFDNEDAARRHFSRFTKEGNIEVFSKGKTSWSATGTCDYKYWEVV